MAGKKINVGTDMKFSKSKGSGSAKLQLPEINPIAAEVSFNCNHNDKADGSIALTYGANKRFETTLGLQLEGKESINVDATVRGELGTLKEITFKLNAKRPTDNEISAKVLLKADSQQYNLDYDHRMSTKEPKFSFNLVRPEGTSKILAEGQIDSPLKGKGQLLVENLEAFNLKANAEGDLTTLENFYLKGDIDSPQIGLNKFTFDVKSKDGAAGRTGFEFKLTKEGKLLVSGSTDFTTKMDKGRTIIEGKSTIKVTDGKSDEVSFKFIRNVFEAPRDGETGFGGILNVFVGPRKFAGEFKMTDKEFHTKYTGCENNNRCTNLETKSILKSSSIDGFEHNFMITVDLREVGFSHEFGLKADTNRDGIKFSHSLDAYLQTRDKPEYQYSLFIKPTEAGALLSLPSRHVALDATYKYPERSLFGDFVGTIAFFVDKKNKPRQKTEFGFRGELKQGDKNQISGKGDLTFEHPRVKKLRVGGEFGANIDTMKVNSKIEFDVFNSPMDVIVIVANFGNSDASGRGFNVTNDIQVYSKGLGFDAKYHEHAGLSFDQRLFTIGSELTLPIKDFRFGANALVTDKSSEFMILAFGQPLLKSNANYDLSKQNLDVETTLQYLGTDPCVQKTSINGLTQGSFTLNKGNLLNVDSGYSIGKDLHLIVKGSGKEIFNGKIALDQSHFLTSNYHVDEVQLKEFTGQLQEHMKNDYSKAEADVKSKFTEIQNFWTQKLEKIQKASPDFSQLQKEYEQEVKNMVEELKQDPAIKKLIDQFTAIIGELAKAFSTISASISEQFATIQDALKKFYEQALTAFNEKILPEIKKLYSSLQKLASDLYEQSVKLLSAVFERVAKSLKTFEEDFNKISKTIRDAFGSTYEAIGQYMKEICQEIKDLFELLKQQLQTLPGVEFVKEKYHALMGDFAPVETLKVVLTELLTSLGQAVPPQAKPLFDKLSEYVQKVKRL